MATGISWTAISDFVIAHGGEAAFVGLSTGDVLPLIVDATAGVQDSYCSTLVAPLVGPANVFVSHAWANSFLALLAAIFFWSTTTTKPGPHFFWFDLFSNSQHGTAEKKFEWWEGVFKHNVRDIGHTILALPWSKPLPLSRSWCIWEIYCTLQTKSRLEIIMSPEDRSTFLNALLDNFSSLTSALCSVDILGAQAAKPEDRDQILKTISETIGAVQVNHLIVLHMQNWMADVGANLLHSVDNIASDFTVNYSHLLVNLGRFDEASPIAKRVWMERLSMLGPDDLRTLVAAKNLNVRATPRTKPAGILSLQ